MAEKEFSKQWDPTFGFSVKEARELKRNVDSVHCVDNPTSQWNPAEIINDKSKKTGYKVVIRKKTAEG